MADLYSQVIRGDGVSTYTVGQNTRKVLTTSDVTGPETTWLVVSNGDNNYETGSSDDAELTTSGSINHDAIVACIQQYCEVYEVVKPGAGQLSLKVRLSSVPYAAGEARNDGEENSILTGIVQAHPDLGGNFTVWNGDFNDDDINWND